MRQLFSVATATIALCNSSMKAALGNMKMNGCGGVPV